MTFSDFVDQNAEEMRETIVYHQDKMKLTVEADYRDPSFAE